MDVKIAFTDKEITPWAGISLMQNMLKKMSFDQILKDLALPSQGSNRGYKPEQLIQTLFTGYLVRCKLLRTFRSNKT